MNDLQRSADASTIQLVESRRDGERVSYGDLAQALRVHIVAKGLPPGARLPTRQQLIQQLGGSTATLQRAINELIDEGFLITRGRAGTFVNQHLPHQCRVGLLFPPMPTGTSELSRFWSTLKRQTELLDPAGPIQIQSYHDLEPHPDNATYRRLVEDLRAHRLGGLMTMCMPHAVVDDLLKQSQVRVARVALMGPEPRQVAHITLEPYIDRVLRRVSQLGCRRFALIYSATDNTEHSDRVLHAWSTAAKARRIEIRDRWLFPVHPAVPASAAHAAELMLRSTPRPDVLVISDDHLVEEATRGVHNAGVKVPEDLHVFGHCNFPDCPSSCVPVHRVGYDIAELLNCGIRLLWRQLQGEKVTDKVMLNSVFDESVEPADRSRKR